MLHVQVLLRPGLDQIARTQASFEFDLERRLLSEDAAAGSSVAAAPLQAVDDPFQLVLERYMQMGYEVRVIPPYNQSLQQRKSA